MTSTSFREIVVPIDGSGLSEMAVPFALEFARRSGGHVTLVRALPESMLVTDIPTAILADVRRAAHAELDAAAARCGKDVPVTTCLKKGFPAEVILGAAAGKDLIVMTTHGRGGISRWVLGSITEKLLRLSPIPVLVIRPRRPASREAAVRAAARMFRDAVVPLDGSATALDAVRPLALIPDRSTRIHVVTVLPKDTDEPASDAAAEYLAGRAAALESRGLPVVTRLIHHDSPSEAIGAYAEAHDCGVIVMSTHGAGGLKEWMMGSVTDRVIRRGPVPVLVVPPHRRGKRGGK